MNSGHEGAIPQCLTSWSNISWQYTHDTWKPEIFWRLARARTPLVAKVYGLDRHLSCLARCSQRLFTHGFFPCRACGKLKTRVNVSPMLGRYAVVLHNRDCGSTACVAPLTQATVTYDYVRRLCALFLTEVPICLHVCTSGGSAGRSLSATARGCRQRWGMLAGHGMHASRATTRCR